MITELRKNYTVLTQGREAWGSRAATLVLLSSTLPLALHEIVEKLDPTHWPDAFQLFIIWTPLDSSLLPLFCALTVTLLIYPLSLASFVSLRVHFRHEIWTLYRFLIKAHFCSISPRYPKLRGKEERGIFSRATESFMLKGFQFGVI